MLCLRRSIDQGIRAVASGDGFDCSYSSEVLGPSTTPAKAMKAMMAPTHPTNSSIGGEEESEVLPERAELCSLATFDPRPEISIVVASGGLAIGTAASNNTDTTTVTTTNRSNLEQSSDATINSLSRLDEYSRSLSKMVKAARERLGSSSSAAALSTTSSQADMLVDGRVKLADDQLSGEDAPTVGKQTSPIQSDEEGERPEDNHFQVQEKVYARDPQTGELFRSRVIKFDEEKGYFIHFLGYSAGYDVWLPATELFKYTPAVQAKLRVENCKTEAAGCVESTNSRYQIGSVVLAEHESTEYKAVVCKIRTTDTESHGHEYFIHWAGWNKKHDKWLPESLLSEYTENAEAERQYNSTDGKDDKKKQSEEEATKRKRSNARMTDAKSPSKKKKKKAKKAKEALDLGKKAIAQSKESFQTQEGADESTASGAPAHMSSLTAIVKYLDKLEPSKNWYNRQKDSRGECSKLRRKLRDFATSDPENPAISHWVKTSSWGVPNQEVFLSLIDLIKSTIIGSGW